MNAALAYERELVLKLIACGPNIVRIAFGHVKAGSPLIGTLEAYTGLEPEDYRAAGVSALPTPRPRSGHLRVIKGGRRQ
jgi:hypothetical protein